MHERLLLATPKSNVGGSLGDNRTKAGNGGRRGDPEVSMRDKTVFCVRILETTQIRRLITFSPAADVTV
jgi:hypothetical protein